MHIDSFIMILKHYISTKSGHSYSNLTNEEKDQMPHTRMPTFEKHFVELS
jgi:hypothetical protein